MFELFLRKVRESKSEFKIGEYIFHFSYANVKIGTLLREEVQITKFDMNILEEDVGSLVFDVIGLNDYYVTQIEIERGTLYVIPDRPVEKIELFRKVMMERQ